MNLCTDCYWTDRCFMSGIEDYISGVTYVIGDGEKEVVTCDTYDPLPKYKEELTSEQEYKEFLDDMQSAYMTFLEED